jgi:hypothetical protein
VSKKAIFKLFLEKINWFYSPQALNYNLNTPFSPRNAHAVISPLPTCHLPLITEFVDKKAIFKLFLEKISYFYSPQAALLGSV